tara:strand:- start:194 stop:496 length:303 start_codon:yes stop_codon:yes gene_type:complete
MLRISETFNKTHKQTQPTSVEEKPTNVRPMKELLRIKEKVEKQIEDQNQRTKNAIADMFLAGPLAWPDYPDYEDVEDPDCEEWIPLDHDSQFRADSSSGE